MRPYLRLLGILAAIGGAVLATSVGVQADGHAYNVSLIKNVNSYPGTNDCWGYTAPSGTELAIYGHGVGTSFVDATDPPNAVEVFNLPGPSSTWRDIKTYQDYAYIVTEGSGAGTGMQIVDLSDPLNPVHVGTYTGSGFTTAHNIWIDTGAGVAYMCGASGGGMNIVSLSDPENPVQLDFFGPYYIHDLYVADGRAYAGAISSGSLRIIDVSNPSNPSTLASHYYSGAATHNSWPTSSGTHCITTDEVSGGHLKVWDISNLSNIQFASSYIVTRQNAIIHNGLIRDDMAYIAYYAAGTQIVDLTDATNPVEVGLYDTSTRNSGFDGNWGVYPFRDDDIFYSSDRQEGLFILEFTGGFAGQISGTVRNLDTAEPLDDAYIKVHPSLTLESSGLGAYSGYTSGGTYDVVTERFGYVPDTTTVTIPEHGSVVHDVDLVQLPFGAVELELLVANTTTPIVGARVGVADTPLQGLVSDANGKVLIPGLPVGLPWVATIGKFGRKLSDVTVTSSEGSTTTVSVEVAPGFADDFDFDQAWIVGAGDDDATDGIWERAIPVGSYFIGVVGPEEDASPTGEGYAYVTERHVPGAFVGTSDVDNGKTTLISPVFDGTGLGTLTLTYQRWFSNRAPSQSDDEFRADVSTDGGASWTNLETIALGYDAWALASIELNALIPITDEMQVRFVAEDLGSNTYVEAGIDDVAIFSTVTDAPRVEETASRLDFASPVPNPFRDATRLSFELPISGPAEISIFDISGRRVVTLLRGDRVAAGAHRVSWDGRDSDGRNVATGIYFAKLVTQDGAMSRKVTLMR
jgi:choice-of-anchor B domain-containing protein